MSTINIYNGVVIKDEFINLARNKIADRKEQDARSDPSDPWAKGFADAAVRWRTGEYDNIFRDDLLKLAHKIQTGDINR